MEGIKKNKKTKFLQISTDEVYGSKAEGSFKEGDCLQPNNPYSASKAAAELIARAYIKTYDQPIIITRSSNNFGPYQYPEKLIPCFIKLLKEDKKVTIQGDGSCVRAFLHSEDTSKAFECILEKGEIGEIYNIGCDEGMEFSVLDIAKILIKKIKNTEKYDEGYSLSCSP